MLLRKEAYVAVPVTAPTAAGLLLVVLTWNPFGPQTSTSTMCQSVILWKQSYSVQGSVQFDEIKFSSYQI